jgi:hypothetical protein
MPFFAKAKGRIMAAAKKQGIKPEGTNSFESLYPEVRFVAIAPELNYEERASGGGTQHVAHITGYAAVFDKTSRRLGNFHERVNKTAFDEAKAGGWDNVVCRYNHDPQMVLGTVGADTCRLEIDDTGLQYDVLPPNCRSDVLEYVERRDCRYSSFAFRCVKEGDDEWGVSKYNMPLRTLHSVELVDVAPVMDPAYKDTTAAARNMEGAVFSLARHMAADPTEVRSMLQAGQAMKFFKRSDRPTVPVLSKAAAEERMVMDDPDVTLRAWEDQAGAYADPEPEPEQRSDETPAETPEERSEEELHVEERAKALKAMDNSKLCMRFHHGEPCVRPTGHPADGPGAAEGGHAGLCFGRKEGLPCNQHDGHDGDHTPITVASRSDETPAETPETPQAELSLEEARKLAEKFDEPIDMSIFND